MVRFWSAAWLTALVAVPVCADGYWAGEGYVVPKDGVTLRVRSTQLVTKVLVDVGAQVRKGDVLLHFDDRNAKIDMRVADLNLKKKELELKHAIARVEIARAAISRSQLEAERLQKLLVSNVATKEEVAKSEAALLAAKAELTAAEVQVEIARVEVETGKAFVSAEEAKIDELTLRAPFDGTIVARYTTVGEWISKPEQGLFDLVSSIYLIEAPVPARLISLLRDKTPIEIAQETDGAERTFKAKVALIGPVVDARTKTVKVHFAIPETEMRNLKPGMGVVVKVGTKKDDE